MKKALSATKLVEKAEQQEELANSIIPSWMVRLGGVTLMLGGLGYLWYRNSSLRDYLRIQDEEFFRLYLKLHNKAFVPRLMVSRIIYTRMFSEFKIEHPNLVFEITHRSLFTKFKKRYLKCIDLSEDPIFQEVLKNSEYSKLSSNHFKIRREYFFGRYEDKQRQGLPIPEIENTWSIAYLLDSRLEIGFIIEGLQRFVPTGEIEPLNHKECLQRLLDYEAETIQASLELYKRVVIVGGSTDLKARREEFDRLYEERFIMEPLEAYAIEKL